MIENSKIFAALVQDCAEELLQSDDELTESEARQMAQAITYASLGESVEII